MTRLRDAERELGALQSAALLDRSAELAAAAQDVGGVAYVAHRVPDGTDADGMRKLALDIRGRVTPGRAAVVVIAGVPADRPTVVVAVNEAGRARGLKAGPLVLTATAVLGGRGGGKDDVAQGGGAPLGQGGHKLIDDSFAAVRTAIWDITGPGVVP